ncbi:hypothetical protein PMZ80_002954 [Knufia obscura]|uniref:Ubiquitin-like domain-containing protein n=1 Tax=Knufia obscura TaxID=1635080 RepID=A0ABR0RYT3_9EURO|nr:hypothetical protein PMZ80_002954 [Knufia obscura]
MASTNPPPSPPTNTNPVPDNVTLRIVILAHGNRAEDDLYLVLSLDTTVGQLKQRIQDSLSHHPSPQLQRLIYQGRPLLDSNVSLRQTLRIDQRGGNTSHVLHLVVRDDTTLNLPSNAGPAQHASSLPPPQPLPTQPLPGQAHVHLPQGMPNVDHMRIHNQLHNIQHQLQHAQAMNRANQARLQAHQLQHQQAMLSQQARMQQQGSGLTLPPANPNGLPQPHQIPPPAQAGLGATPQGPGETTRIEERIGPNGEHIRTTISNNGTASMTFRVTGVNVPSPLDRPSSAPGSSPTAASDPANRSANAIPSNIQIHANQPHVHTHAQPPHLPLGLPFPPGQQLPVPFPSLMQQPMYNPMLAGSTNTSQGQTMAWLLSSPQGPQGIVFAPGHGFFSTLPSITTLPSQVQQQTTQPQPTPTVPTATGPQPTTTGAQQAQLVVRPQDGNGRQTNQPAPPQPGARPQQPVPAGQPQPAQPAQAQQPRPNEENALFNLLLARAWLFLRLYMFVFVLSESGTWRRIFMLGSAIIFCLLPRQNPFAEAFQAARRHFDNLIGPPNIPQRQGQNQQAQGQGQGQVGQNNDNNNTGSGAAATAARTQPQAPMPTPEEAARRLLEQQNRRNPNPVLDALYRVEQGVVLFLASLIPGLGERHIQAREQARRILEEEERRVREERERQEQAQQVENGQRQEGSGDGQANSHKEKKNEGGPLPADWGTAGAGDAGGGSGAEASASASGVDRNTGTGEQAVRSRNTGAQ